MRDDWTEIFLDIQDLPIGSSVQWRFRNVDDARAATRAMTERLRSHPHRESYVLAQRKHELTVSRPRPMRTPVFY